MTEWNVLWSQLVNLRAESSKHFMQPNSHFWCLQTSARKFTSWPLHVQKCHGQLVHSLADFSETISCNAHLHEHFMRLSAFLLHHIDGFLFCAWQFHGQSCWFWKNKNSHLCFLPEIRKGTAKNDLRTAFSLLYFHCRNNKNCVKCCCAPCEWCPRLERFWSHKWRQWSCRAILLRTSKVLNRLLWKC